MENASKALLIAAAVLIVIALIAFSVQVFNSTKDVTEDVTPTADWMTLKTTVAAIDVQFSKYNGNQKGTTVKQMLEEVSSYNKSHGTYSASGDDSTTQLKRKIAVQINKKNIPEADRLEKFKVSNSEVNPSSTDTGTILEYIPYIDDNSYYNVKTKEYLDFPKEGDELFRRNAIYIIQIGF